MALPKVWAENISAKMLGYIKFGDYKVRATQIHGEKTKISLYGLPSYRRVILSTQIVCILILIICINIELNAGPKKDKSCNKFSLCHSNLNSIMSLESQ